MTFTELVFHLSQAWNTRNRKLLCLAARYYLGIDTVEELRQYAPPAMADEIIRLR